MPVTRPTLRTTLTTLALAAAAPAAFAAEPAPVPPADLAAYATCMSGIRADAATQGITGASFDRLTAGLQPDMTVLPLLNAQPEFTTPLWDYLAGLVDQQRVDDGKALLAEHRELLARVAAQYGVDAETVVAVWGVESDYGRVFGKRPLLVSLSTLACNGRRQPFFRGELLATLKLLDAGDLRNPGITGSWAGAFGHTQFMPSTYAGSLWISTATAAAISSTAFPMRSPRPRTISSAPAGRPASPGATR